jgi:glycosyltransferase involved in cell wall biosynthesis
MPPARTGIADYSQALSGALRAHADIRLNADGDLNLYHLGNNQLHRDIYHRAIARPGVVVLHDAVLHHFFLGSHDEEAYVEEFVHNYAEWSRPLAAKLWRGRSRSAADVRYFRYPMLRRVAESARVLIVHNPAAAAMVRSAAPTARVVEIPHLFVPPAPVEPWRIERLRQTWGLGPSAFVFGVFGHLRESKRIATILKAFRLVRASLPQAVLLMAGDFVSSDLARAFPESEPGVIRYPYLPESDFWIAAHAVDACISLRYPAAGETSGISIRLMGIGKPVIVTADAETSLFPTTGCLRIDPGPVEQDMLVEAMRMLIQFPDFGRRIGRLAGTHITSVHAIETVAMRYWETLTKAV